MTAIDYPDTLNTPAQLRADLREKRKAYEEEVMRPDVSPEYEDISRAYHRALGAAAHLGPDPVEEAFERYRASFAPAAERLVNGVAEFYAAREALDAAILGEATGE